MNLRQLSVAIITFSTLFSLISGTEKTTLDTILRPSVSSGTTARTHLVTEKTSMNTILPDFDFPPIITLSIVIHTRVLPQHLTPPKNVTLTSKTKIPAVTPSGPDSSVTSRISSVQTLHSEVHSVTPATVSSTIVVSERQTSVVFTEKTNPPNDVLKGLVVMRPEIEIIFPENTPGSLVENVTAYNIYGNRKDTYSAYQYVFPVVIGICVLTTLVLVYCLIQRLRKAKSKMNKASCLLLIAVALMDLLTMCFALAEICFLFSATSDNSGFIPLTKCRAMSVLERLSAIPHAASTWVTVILAIQRFYCVSKPFSASKYITVRSSYILIVVVSVFVILLHICRFFDNTFLSVEVNVNNKTIISCQDYHNGWIHNPVKYESVFAWTRISVAQFIPGVLMVLFVTLMIKSLRDTTKKTKRMKLNDSNLKSDRRQLSLFVAIVAIIVFCVEVSSGIFLSLSAWEMSTGQEIVSYQSLKSATTAFDLVLYVSYFAIFLLYCFMSKDIRRTLVSVWCVRRCTIQLNCSSDQETVTTKSTTLTHLPLQEGTSSANQSPVLTETHSNT